MGLIEEDGNWRGFEKWERGREGVLLCIRVLTISNGCTTSVDTMPALRPATDSIIAGDGPAW